MSQICLRRSTLPFAFRPLDAALLQMGPALDEAGRVLGFPVWYRFLFIVIPGIRPALVSAAMLCFAHTLGEFGVVLMIGGNIPGETRTIAIAIYDRVQAFDGQAAAQMSAFLLALSLVTITLTIGLSRRVGRRLG